MAPRRDRTDCGSLQGWKRRMPLSPLPLIEICCGSSKLFTPGPLLPTTAATTIFIIPFSANIRHILRPPPSYYWTWWKGGGRGGSEMMVFSWLVVVWE